MQLSLVIYFLFLLNSPVLCFSPHYFALMMAMPWMDASKINFEKKKKTERKIHCPYWPKRKDQAYRNIVLTLRLAVHIKICNPLMASEPSQLVASQFDHNLMQQHYIFIWGADATTEKIIGETKKKTKKKLYFSCVISWCSVVLVPVWVEIALEKVLMNFFFQEFMLCVYVCFFFRTSSWF
jgi:hypothetical protein